MALVIPYQTNYIGLKSRSLQFFNFPGTLSLIEKEDLEEITTTGLPDFLWEEQCGDTVRARTCWDQNMKLSLTYW